MIDLTKPIEVNGKPVEVLTGWCKQPKDTSCCCAEMCIVGYDMSLWTMDSAGAMYRIEMAGLAHNAKPNIVGVGDYVTLAVGSAAGKVIATSEDHLWVRWPNGDHLTYDLRTALHLNGLPIDGIRQ